MSRTVDLTGQRVGRLLVVKRIANLGRETQYECACDCGNTCITGFRNLYKGKSSCGCARVGWRKVSDRDKKISQMWANYRDKAKRRSLEWGLTKECFSSLVTSRCHYCGTMPMSGFVGVDRMDSSIGYIQINCVSACSQCNFAKSDTPYDVFKEWIERVYGHLFHER